MAQDQSEKIDDYCNDMYGHTNWGYIDTYSKDELNAKDHDIDGHIVYWHEEAEPDVPEGWSYCDGCEDSFPDEEDCDCEQ